jgi:hypothetical protein
MTLPRRLLAAALLAAPAACTFPDVDYVTGGTATTTSSSGGGATPDASSGSVDAGCADGCTGAAATCAQGAQTTHTTCVTGCKNNQGCTMNCDKVLSSARTACAQTCVTCAGTSCTGAPAACDAAAGT